MFVIAWGESDFVAPGGVGGGNASGFDAEEGFDSFLAMQAPPEVSDTYLVCDRSLVFQFCDFLFFF